MFSVSVTFLTGTTKIGQIRDFVIVWGRTIGTGGTTCSNRLTPKEEKLRLRALCDMLQCDIGQKNMLFMRWPEHVFGVEKWIKFRFQKNSV